MRALWTLLLLGCGFAATGVSMEPPVGYRAWWERTEACSGLAGDFDRVEWLVVPGADFPCASGRCVGHWQGRTVWLAEPWVGDELVVRHEMLHALLQRSGHPAVFAVCRLTWATRIP